MFGLFLILAVFFLFSVSYVSWSPLLSMLCSFLFFCFGSCFSCLFVCLSVCLSVCLFVCICLLAWLLSFFRASLLACLLACLVVCLFVLTPPVTDPWIWPLFDFNALHAHVSICVSCLQVSSGVGDSITFYCLCPWSTVLVVSCGVVVGGANNVLLSPARWHMLRHTISPLV